MHTQKEGIESEPTTEYAEATAKTRFRAFGKRIGDFLARTFSEHSPFMRIFCRWVWIVPPIFVLLSMLILFKAQNLYPFSDRTISWSDMDQQYVPLLLDFKDILAGKEGFFFSLKNAAGMNFFGVFFYFLSSPFTFLIVFVDKADILSFANVITMLKMCAIAATASFYLSRKYPSAPALNLFLSVLYAYSGYVMMYYQVSGWLDVVYLFPILLLGLEELRKGKRVLFTFTLAASMIVNFYIGYMLVIFLLLYALGYILLSKDKKFAANFVLCCAIAALLSAIVWLPSFLQYFTSGRRTSIMESLRNSSALTNYSTAIPVLFSVIFLFPFAFSRKKATTIDVRLRFLLFLATLVPIFIEPINKMWQTGNYMCFPTRYSFITIFLCITCAMDALTAKNSDEEMEKTSEKTPVNTGKKWKNDLPRYALNAFLLLFSVFYCVFAIYYANKNAETIDQYSQTLWGNAQSFEALFKLYAIAFFIGLAWCFCPRMGEFKNVFLWLSVGALVLSELYVAPVMYMLTPAHSTAQYRDVIELENVIEDDGFYRVKTDKEYAGRDFDATTLGGLGYNALGHYTSLTSQRYMTAIKRFGYTSYWMEVGNSGGTVLTDALLSVKYQISSSKSAGDIYQGAYYSISPTASFLPLGVCAKTDIIANASAFADRASFQKQLAQDFFNTDDLVTVYGLENATLTDLAVTERNGKLWLTPTEGSEGTISFRVNTRGKERVYVNIFDEYSNAVNQAINGDFTVYSPKYASASYPSKKQNGLLYVGEYTDASFSIKIGVKETTAVRELGIMSIQTDKLAQAVNDVKTVDFAAGKNTLSGKIQGQGGECVFLSVPYDRGLTLKINGKKSELHEVYGGFTAFYLQEGENDIQIEYLSPGFAAGAALSSVGVGLCTAAFVLWLRKKQSVTLPTWSENASYYALIVAGAAVVLLVYIIPLIISAL